MSFSNAPIHVIDFEGSLQSGIVEYGIATISNGVIESTHTRLCRPYGTIPYRETACHGIYEDELTRLLPIDTDWNLFSSLRGSGPFAAHNAFTEHQLLKAVWPYTASTQNFSDGQPSVTWGPWIDTLRLYENLYQKLPSYKLESLIETFQLQENLDALSKIHCPEKRRQYHSALYDAIACALLICRLINMPQFHSDGLPLLFKYSSYQQDCRQMELF